ncbi:MAG: biopolymer transporter ExbD [Planctomycetota bacterium]|nr:biopolymer transporter ExbD [Planctomycetota bacterium]
MRINKSDAALAEVDMTPMIDIVFQLIAFFMVISNFEQTQADERVRLPEDVLAQPPTVKPAHELVLNVGFIRDPQHGIPEQGPVVFYNAQFCRITDTDSPSEVLIYNRISNSNETRQTVPFAYRLDQEKRLFHGRGVSPAEEVTVVIRADSRVPTGIVQKLIQMSQEPFTGGDGSSQGGFAKFALKAEQTAASRAFQSRGN